MDADKSLKISEVSDKLPPEGQRWLRNLKARELAGMENVLTIVGEANFIKHWEHHRDELAEFL